MVERGRRLGGGRRSSSDSESGEAKLNRRGLWRMRGVGSLQRGEGRASQLELHATSESIMCE